MIKQKGLLCLSSPFQNHDNRKLTITVKALADLGCNIRQVESLIHGRLGVLAVGSRDHMSTVISRTEVIREFCLVEIGDGGVFLEGRVATADALAGFQGFGCDVFCDPVGVTELTLVGE